MTSKMGVAASKDGTGDMGANLPVSSAKAFAEIMRSRRLDRGLTQADLADRVGKSRKWVIGVERGDLMPTLQAVIQVCRALGYSMSLWEEPGDNASLLAEILGER